ncbi:MAG: WD40 repeat domain-containing protein [Planctomycetaceae bacterium]
MVFTPDGRRLYAAGWDKVVHCWVRDGQNWTYRKELVLRVPIGGEIDGVISSIAISSDGSLLAAGGKAPKRGVAGQRDRGVSMSADELTNEQKLDEGLIYVFDLRTGKVTILRGHEGAVFALSFAPKRDNSPAEVLISAAELFNEKDGSHGQMIAWDASAGDVIAKLESFTADSGTERRPLPEIRAGMLPQICPLSPSDGSVSVAVSWSTWPDSGFGLRLWDIRNNRLSPPINDDPGIYYSLIDVTVDPARPAFVSGSANRMTGMGELARWQPGSAEELSLDRDRSLIKTFGVQQIPLNIGGFDRDKLLAVVYDISPRPAGAADARGRLWEVGMSRSTAPIARLTLKSNDFCFAKCPETNIVAWEQNGEGLRIADVVRFSGNNHLLKSASSQMYDRVEFVEREGGKGVRLSSTHGNDSKVFDIENSRVTNSSDEWKTSRPDAQWSIRHEVNEKGIAYHVINKQDAGRTYAIDAHCDEVAPNFTPVGAFVFNLPEMPPFLITAFNCNAQPNIRVYDLTTGNLIRRYSAHTGPITSMALSADERMLVTSAQDGTVRAWWLPSLASHVGTTGAIRDGNSMLSTAKDGDRLVVKSNCKPFRADDVINECRYGDDSIVPETSLQLVKWLSKIKPGETIVVDTSRGGKEVRVGQAVDWHRELFALHLQQSGQQLHWIAWTPQGIYDFNESAVKNELGWHFNTGDPEFPVRYATVDAYPENHKRGFLKALCETGELAAQVLQMPETTLVFADKLQGFPSFHQPGEVVEAKFHLSGDLPSNFVKAVKWIVHDEQNELARGVAVEDDYEENSWSINTVIPENLSKSGYYQLTAVVETADEFEARLSDSVEFRYQRPAPKLQVVSDVPKTTTAGELAAKLNIASSSECAVDVTIEAFDKDNAVVESIRLSVPAGNKESVQDFTVSLAEGYNKIVFTAVNQDALPGFEENETFHLSLSLFSKTSPDDSSPQLTSLIVTPTADPDAEAVDMFHAKTIELPSPHVTISGQITCKSELKSATLKMDDADIPITHQATDESGLFKYDFRSDLTLSLGEHSLTFAFLDDKGHRAQPQYFVTYLPPLPELDTLQAAPAFLADSIDAQGATFKLSDNLIIDGVHDSTVSFSTAFRTQDHEPLYEQMGLSVVAVIDGQELPATEAEVKRGAFTAAVPIPKGPPCSVSLRVKDRWGRSVTSNSETMVRLDKPLVDRNPLPDSVDHPELVAVDMMLSAPGWNFQPDRFFLSGYVNGIRLPLNADADYQIKRAADDSFRIVLSRVPLQSGVRDNHLQVMLHHRGDGANSHSDVADYPLIDARIAVDPEAEEGSTKIFADGLSGEIGLDRFKGDIEIESHSELRYVQISWNNHSRTRKYDDPVEIGGHKQSGNAGTKMTYVFEELIDDLSPGETQIVIFAAGADGFSHAVETVNYVPSPPVNGGIELKSDDAIDWVKVHSFGEELANAAPHQVGTPYVELQCRIKTLASGNNVEPVSVWVNGFFQGSLIFPRKDSPDLISRPLTVCLSRTVNRIELHGLPQDVKTKNYFEVECSSPVVSQELYFVLIDATQDERNRLSEAKLKEKAKEAISAYSDEEKNLVSAAFDRIENQYVFTGRDVTKRKIFKALGEIRTKARPVSRGSVNKPLPVTIFYYHGRERKIASHNASFELLVSGSDWDNSDEGQKSREITDTQLAGKLNEIGGAHLAFLDVDTVADADKWQTRWPNYANLGVFRVVRKATKPGEIVAAESAERMPLITKMGEKIKDSPYLVDLSENLKSVFTGRQNLAYDFNIPEMLKNLTIYKGE